MAYKTALTYGTFDMFHIGHLELLKRVSSLADRVIVGVSTDDFNRSKDKKCVIPYEQRASIVSSIKGVDLVIPEYSWEQKENDILRYSVDLFVMGNDWEGEFDHLNSLCEVRYLARTEGVSTSQIKEMLKGVSPKLKSEINNLFEILEIIKNELN